MVALDADRDVGFIVGVVILGRRVGACALVPVGGDLVSREVG